MSMFAVSCTDMYGCPNNDFNYCNASENDLIYRQFNQEFENYARLVDCCNEMDTPHQQELDSCLEPGDCSLTLINENICLDKTAKLKSECCGKFEQIRGSGIEDGNKWHDCSRTVEATGTCPQKD